MSAGDPGRRGRKRRRKAIPFWAILRAHHRNVSDNRAQHLSNRNQLTKVCNYVLLRGACAAGQGFPTPSPVAHDTAHELTCQDTRG